MDLYIIKSVCDGHHYIGITKDISNRLSEHNTGEVKSTKAYAPWIVVHTERYDNKTDARKRELFLKHTAKARAELFAKIDSGPIV